MKLLLPYAYDSNGNLVHIDNAQKGHKYTCPYCGGIRIIQKSDFSNLLILRDFVAFLQKIFPFIVGFFNIF